MPICWITPWSITAMRSAVVIASSWSWVTKIVVMPRLPLQREQLVAHLHAQLRVEVRQRLVEQQHLRLDREGARERDALLLAAGELAGRRSP